MSGHILSQINLCVILEPIKISEHSSNLLQSVIKSPILLRKKEVIHKFLDSRVALCLCSKILTFLKVPCFLV